jgi:L-iditol 2-dehydrogenase
MTTRSMPLVAKSRFAAAEAQALVPGLGEALVRIDAVGVCGSDIHLFKDGAIGGLDIEFPFVVGHECMGTVQATGPGADPSLVGRRVAVEPHIPCGECRWCSQGLENVCPNDRFLGVPPTPGAMQEFLAHPARLLEPLPDSISDEAGVVLEPLAIALHAVRLAKLKPGQTVLVLGAGVLGTCVLALLNLRRDLRVAAADLMPDRLARAQGMGAGRCILAEPGSRKPVVDSVADFTEGRGADVVFECAGAEDTFRNACDAAAPAGHVLIIGIPDGDVLPLSASSARRRGLTLRMIRRSLHTLRPCIRLVVESGLRLDPLVTHRFHAKAAQEAFELVQRREDGVLKAVIDMRRW